MLLRRELLDSFEYGLIFCFVRHNGFSWLTVPEIRFYLKYGENKLGGVAPPHWKAQQVGIVTSQNAQLASAATVYKELQSQAAKLAALILFMSRSRSLLLPMGLNPERPGVF